jgi:hypothetical protein
MSYPRGLLFVRTFDVVRNLTRRLALRCLARRGVIFPSRPRGKIAVVLGRDFVRGHVLSHVLAVDAVRRRIWCLRCLDGCYRIRELVGFYWEAITCPPSAFPVFCRSLVMSSSFAEKSSRSYTSPAHQGLRYLAEQLVTPADAWHSCRGSTVVENDRSGPTASAARMPMIRSTKGDMLPPCFFR